MKMVGQLLFLLIGILSLPLHANELLMKDVDASVIQTDHDTAVRFWNHEESQRNHKFFEGIGGHFYEINELNQRAIHFWQKLEQCKGPADAKALAFTLINLNIECPNLLAEFQALKINYIEFLSSAEMNPQSIKLENSIKLGRVPLHPLLQQFSFNFYVHLIFIMQFEEGYLQDHDLYKVLNTELEPLLLVKQKKRAAEAAAEAAWKRDRINPPSIWSAAFRGSGAAEWATHKLREIEEMDAMTKRSRQYYENWDENHKYAQMFDRFVANNLILMTQNLSHQFYGRTCTGIGIFENANLSGIFTNSLKYKAVNSNAAEHHFRGVIMSMCNSRIFNKTNIVAEVSKRVSHEDPSREAIALSKLVQVFLNSTSSTIVKKTERVRK